MSFLPVFSIRSTLLWVKNQRPHSLMITDDKTEFLLTGTRQQLAKINTACSVTVGEYDIDPSLCIRYLGVWFDSQ